MIVEAGKSPICRAASRLKTYRETDAAVQVQMLSAGKIPFSSGEVSLFPVQAFNGLDEAHPHFGE